MSRMVHTDEVFFGVVQGRREQRNRRTATRAAPRGGRVVSALLVGLIVTVSGSVPASAASGDLDPKFGVGGQVTRAIGTTSAASSIVALPTGDLLVAGSTDRSLFIARLHANGTPDPSFGANGVTVIVGVFPSDPVPLAVQSDGRILSGGWVSTTVDVTAWSIVRLDPDGTPDSGFGSSGRATVDVGAEPFSPETAVPHVIRVLGSGRILIGGDAASCCGLDRTGALVALTSAGVLDPSFGTGGRVVPAGPPITGLAMQGSDIVVAGGGLRRFNADGTLDAGFSVGALPVPFAPVAVVVDSSQKIVAAGDGLGHFVFRRFERDGGIDKSFGNRGRRDVNFAIYRHNQTPLFDERNGSVRAIAQRPDGTILATGTNGIAAAVVALTRNGAVDTSFGEHGRVVYRTQPANGLAIDGTGRVLVAAATHGAASAKVRIFRLGSSARQIVGAQVLDAYGTLHPVGDALSLVGPVWPGWDVARGVSVFPWSRSGLVVDAFGGLHDVGQRPVATIGAPYWPGWDIVRGVATHSTTFDGSGEGPQNGWGVVADGWGGLHPFALELSPIPAPTHVAYWVGWDIVRGVALLPDGTGGYTLDGWGGLHPFGVGSHAPPPAVTSGPYWSGWDIARGVDIAPGGKGGYIVDGFGGVHAFGIGGATPPPRSHRRAVLERTGRCSRDRRYGLRRLHLSVLRRELRLSEAAVDLMAHDLALAQRMVKATQESAIEQRFHLFECFDLCVQRTAAFARDHLPLGDTAGPQDAVDVVECQTGVLQHADEHDPAQIGLRVAALS